ncbi:hypothetical protein Igni_1190 [Ignicoccus hospitalis KIN4/I]|uniref:Methyltransferase FkbM family n=1 Tax=Ignicoccus hospitalis (strain KIN4/I / DSM 18386 / JCM 14125) TaxID=453591 RepID=A8ABR5_IGNH4|nr:hypothetical protein Igni_1190 [Ignicoccus hospitalis KIN4/I]
MEKVEDFALRMATTKFFIRGESISFPLKVLRKLSPLFGGRTLTETMFNRYLRTLEWHHFPPWTFSYFMYSAVFHGVLYALIKAPREFVEACELFEAESKETYVNLLNYLALADLLKFMAPSVVSKAFTFCYIPKVDLEKRGIRQVGLGKYLPLYDIRGLFKIENSDSLLKEIFACESYKCEECGVTPLDDSAFVDLGAAYGETALWYALYSSNSKLLAVDASQEALAVARRNEELAREFLRSKNNEMIIINKLIKKDTDARELINLGKDKNAYFIKSDIEGYEREALEAFKDVLKEYKPYLALAAYHKWDDLIVLPKKVKEANPDYKLYLRPHITFYKVPYGHSYVLFAR